MVCWDGSSAKRSGAIRICVDFKPPNKCVLREVHPLPKVDDTLAQLAGAKVFTKLDANSKFWQIPLSEESCLLTTFITPSRRYCFNKLPFGISSALKHFQKQIQVTHIWPCCHTMLLHFRGVATQTVQLPMAGGKPVLSRDMQHFKHHLKNQHS